MDTFRGVSCISTCSETQTELFESSGVKSLLDSALNGYAATILAYGQTGSGKTFTMSGYDSGGSGGKSAVMLSSL